MKKILTATTICLSSCPAFAKKHARLKTCPLPAVQPLKHAMAAIVRRHINIPRQRNSVAAAGVDAVHVV